MYQTIILIGNLGSDPEMRYMQDGTAVTNFSMATNRKWKAGDGTLKEEVTWFRVSVWGRQAEACNQYLSKGRQVMVEGRLKPDPETGGPRVWAAQDGTSRASFEVTANDVKFLSGGSSDGGQQAPAQSQATKQEDDIPF